MLVYFSLVKILLKELIGMKKLLQQETKLNLNDL
jgi:hypothetical protein